MNNIDNFHNDFFKKLEDRNKRIADKITSVYHHENPDIAFIIGTMNYWIDGENPGLIPDDYFKDPSVGSAILREPSEIKQLHMPDPYKDGLMPRVLDTIDFMRRYTDLPVSVTDPQGPLTIAINICGVENLFVWMLTDPDLVHVLMEFCSDVLIDWIKVQKSHAGQSLDSGAWPHGILLPEGFGGVWLADDDCTQVSAELYKEFVVPYNSKVLKALALF